MKKNLTLTLLSLVFVTAHLTSCEETLPENLLPVWPEMKLGSIEKDPVINMVIIFDASQSNNIAEAKKALSTYISSLPENVQLGLVTFGGSKVELDIGTDKKTLEQVVQGMSADNGTPLGPSVGKAYQLLASRAVTETGFNQYHIAIITDGEADSRSFLKRNIDEILKESTVSITTIGFKVGENHSLNREGIRYISADDSAELSKGLEQILAEAPIDLQ